MHPLYIAAPHARRCVRHRSARAAAGRWPARCVCGESHKRCARLTSPPAPLPRGEGERNRSYGANHLHVTLIVFADRGSWRAATDSLAQHREIGAVYRAGSWSYGDWHVCNWDCRRLGCQWCTLNLGMVESDSGAFAIAVQHLADADTQFQQLGDQSGIAWCRFNQGQTAMRCGDAQQAAACFADAQARFVAIGDPWGQAWALAHLGDAACALSDHTAAGVAFQQSAEIMRQQQSVGGVPRLAEGCARLVLALHGPQPAAVELFAAAATLMESASEQRRSADQDRYDQTLQALRAALGDAACTSAWAAGTLRSACGARSGVARCCSTRRRRYVVASYPITDAASCAATSGHSPTPAPAPHSALRSASFSAGGGGSLV